jgi:hypothetical protein
MTIEIDLSKVKARQDAYLRYAEIPPVWNPATQKFERTWKPPRAGMEEFHFSPAFMEYAKEKEESALLAVISELDPTARVHALGAE